MMIDRNEMDSFFQVLLNQFGYDFTEYNRSSLERRLKRILLIWKSPDLDDLFQKIMRDNSLLVPFVQQLTVPFTTMFRDPEFFLAMRQQIIPYLSTFPLIRIWIAGCSTGEEAYTTAVLLKECGLLQRSLIYATDINGSVVERASKGIFPMENMHEYVHNYALSGGNNGLSAHYSANHGIIQFSDELRSRMVFSTHNLVSDASFNSFQLILCRNVLIYFNRTLQNRVIRLFYESLENSGFLGLGPKETLVFSSLESRFQRIGQQKIWKKLT